MMTKHSKEERSVFMLDNYLKDLFTLIEKGKISFEVKKYSLFPLSVF